MAKTPKWAFVTVRAPAEQVKDWRKAAKTDGKTLSAWMRPVLDTAATGKGSKG